MSTSAVGSSSASNLEALIQKFVERVDANKDGQISKSEFGSFLSTLLAGLESPKSGVSSSSNSNNTLVAADAGSSTPTLDAPEDEPATWYGGNGYNGYTFAGFSPQDHRNLTLKTLGDYGNEKYAAFSFLIANKIDPRTDWAPAVADALNKKYNTDAFKAVKPTKLQWRGEYIRSSDVGFCMQPGTYCDKSVGQFFWCTEY